jgi:hypothetical protein
MLRATTYGGKSLDGVVRKSRRHNDMRAGPNKLDGNLVPNLDTATGYNRHAPHTVGRLKALQMRE